MDKSTWRQRLSYFTLFIPFRFYLLLFAAGITLAWWWLLIQKPDDTTAFAVVLALLIKIAAYFMLAIFVLSILSVLVPYFLFWWQRKRGHVKVRISNSQKDNSRQLLQRMEMTVEPLWQPPFGFLYYRFLYDKNQLSPKFSLASTGSKKKLFQPLKSGLYNWPLPTIREYEVEKLVVYFEDIFQFFSFSMAVHVDQSFFTKPRKTNTPQEELIPKKTETQNVRIEELRRVQGEFLNYKNFEDNDDVRRIVWKIYAKNKELVVRTQEIFDPFASHTYLYCSYYDSIGVTDAAMMETRGLNYFKNICWSVYSELKKSWTDVKFITDQDIPTRYFDGVEQQVEYAVAVSRWHQQLQLQNYVKPQDASVLCISSLTDVTALSNLLDQMGGGITVVFVKLTNSLRKANITNWIRWLFLQEEKDKDKTGMINWRWSSLKRKVKQNEKKIESLLKSSEARIIRM